MGVQNEGKRCTNKLKSPTQGYNPKLSFLDFLQLPDVSPDEDLSLFTIKETKLQIIKILIQGTMVHTTRHTHLSIQQIIG